MDTPQPSNLNTLRNLTNTKLQELWIELRVRGDPPHFKHALLHGIAWRIQTQTHGVRNAETRRLLRASVRNAPSVKSIPRAGTRRIRRTQAQLTPGTTLVRTWRGHEHTVEVIGEGKQFRYMNREYDSLSEIARDITGARWSGPRFFGLTKLRSTA